MHYRIGVRLELTSERSGRKDAADRTSDGKPFQTAGSATLKALEGDRVLAIGKSFLDDRKALTVRRRSVLKGRQAVDGGDRF